jgi:hypothetical protein
MDAKDDPQKIIEFINSHIDETIELIVKVTKTSLPGQYSSTLKDKLIEYTTNLILKEYKK